MISVEYLELLVNDQLQEKLLSYDQGTGKNSE